MEYRSLSTRQQIRNLILLITSGVLCAFLLSGLLVYYYGPTGQYVVRNALLDPGVLPRLAYDDHNSRFVFDSIDFSYFDTAQKQWKHLAISPEHYRKFYSTIESDVSLEKVEQSVEALFNQVGAATLSLKVRSEYKSETKTFQQVQLLNNGDYYRIQLREESSPTRWIYFRHPGIYNQALQLFTGQAAP